VDGAVAASVPAALAVLRPASFFNWTGVGVAGHAHCGGRKHARGKRGAGDDWPLLNGAAEWGFSGETGPWATPRGGRRGGEGHPDRGAGVADWWAPATVWGGAVQTLFESNSKIQMVYFNSKSFQTLTDPKRIFLSLKILK
jgi:hypothetical protein